LILFCSVVLPLVQLLIWGWSARATGDTLATLMGHSFVLAGSAAVIITFLALLLASGSRFSVAGKSWAALANLGYALPGSVLAVAIVSLAGPIDSLWVNVGSWLGRVHQPLLIGSIAGLLLAYMVRFMRPAYGPLISGMERIRPHIPEAAQLLGAGRARILTRIYIPILTPALLTASLLVFVDVLKEMPATLLLRPFGWDTLATRIYQLTGESQWQWAAVPALVLVAVSVVPVVVLILQSRRSSRE
jgi:iron(III) transport system permease protein